ncbi:hypothetical protein CR513_16413, partial [Mucuna pruriens]
MKDLGKFKYFQGIVVAYSKKGSFISQRTYVFDLLKESGKLRCRTHRIIERIMRKKEPRLIRPDTTISRSYSKERGLLFKQGGNLTMGVYTNANYAGEMIDWRSTSRWELVYMGVRCKMLLLDQMILDDLKIRYEGSMKLLYHNKVTISISYNPVQYDRTMHIEID